jgi:ribosomal protein S12 methylthiotransferase
MKAYIVSLGCPKNLTDTEVLMGQLVSSGYQIINYPSAADIIIVNTCAFLKSARQEAVKVLREMKRYKKKLYLAGCLPQWLEKTRNKINIPRIDGVIDSLGLFDYCTPRIKATPPWTAYVKIAEGCNNCCSYCLIPTIRGRLKTRKLADILNEVNRLAKRGVKEIIYVAQDTTAYPGFAKLLKRTAGIKGIHWIRILYAHPAHLNTEIIKTIAAERKIVKYLDLPIQHVNDAILKRMNRKYTRLDLERLISELRKRIPGITLRTSVIVGFPGEGEKEFAELMAFIKEIKFDRLGVFKYEREKGAAAAGMKPQVSEKKKEMRFRKLMRLQARTSKELNRKMVGKTLEVLIEGKYFGRSYRDAPEIDGKVIVKSPRNLKPGSLIKVKVIKSGVYDLIGTRF